MEKILVAVMTKFGAFKTEVIKCNEETVFDFLLDIDPQMRPHFTVEVYHVRDKDVVEHGSIKIETKEMAVNFVSCGSDTYMVIASNIFSIVAVHEYVNRQR